MKKLHHSDSLLRRLSLAAVGVALIVIALGALTRLVDAGLGCPDWPGCYGHLLPQGLTGNSMQQWPHATFVAYKAWAEMIHRYAVSVLGLLMSVIVFSIAGSRTRRIRMNLMLAAGLLLLLVYQILLGQWTVTLRLWPVIVTQHLLGGFFILTTLWMVFLQATSPERVRVPASFRVWGMLSLGLLLIQIFLGAWTSTNYASLSCPDFPFCVNDHPVSYALREAFQLRPAGIDYEGGVLSLAAARTIQVCHRLGALLVSINLLALVATVVYRQWLPLARVGYVISALLLVQICLGIVNVLFHLPVLPAIFHTLGAALLLLATMTLVWRTRS